MIMPSSPPISLLSPRRVLPMTFVIGWLLVVWNQIQQQTKISSMTADLLVSMEEYVSGTARIAADSSRINNSTAVMSWQPGPTRDHNKASQILEQEAASFARRSDPMPKPLPEYAKSRNYIDLPSYIPPLDSLIDLSPATNHSIIGNVSYLLDFAIIGFGKCGTSTLMHWLADHAETQVLTVEMWSLVGDQPHYLIARLHRSLTRPHALQRGYKCPGDILQPHAMHYYHKLWPQAKLFVGVRHPIWHFQSLYNFRIQNFKDSYMHHPNRLIGACYGGHKMTCTHKSDWAYYLFALGKQFLQTDGTSIDIASYQLSDLEESVVNGNPTRRKPFTVTDIRPIRNKIFIFELGQLGDKNESRRTQFQADVQQYLGLTEPLAPVHHVVPGKVWPQSVQDAKDALKINICDHDYTPLRRELLRQARLSADWIEQVFIKSHGVYASNLEHLSELLATWRDDPCGPQSIQMTEDESLAIVERTRKAPASDTKKQLLEFLEENTPVD